MLYQFIINKNLAQKLVKTFRLNQSHLWIAARQA
jgi:hypothetical protein